MTIILNNYFVTLGFSPEQIRVFIAQSAHETSFWSSRVFKNALNLYGIKGHKRRIAGKKNEEYNGYATYSNIEASVNDYIDLIRRRNIIETSDNLYNFAFSLKKAKYYEASLREYTNGMINAYKKLFPESSNKYDLI